MNHGKNPIYCIGGANIDYKFKAKSTLHQGSSNSVRSHFSFGGVARNVAENLAHVTQPIYFQSVFGNDEKAKLMLKHLAEKKINSTACLTLLDYKTAHYYAILDDKNDLFIAVGEMEIYEHIPFSAFITPWDQWLDNSIIFIDTNLSSELIQHAIHLCQTKNIRLCIDPVSIEKSSKLPDDLSSVYLIKPNQDEASALTGMSTQTINECFLAGNTLINRGVQNCVISLGCEGYIIVNKNHHKHYPIEPVTSMIDSNGAGDAFIAGILWGLQQDLDLIASCQLGATAAANAVQSLDSVYSTKHSITETHDEPLF